MHAERDQLKLIKAYLKTLSKVSFEEKAEALPPYVIDNLKKGQADIQARRSFTLKEFDAKYDPLEDRAYLDMLDQRMRDLDSGKVQGLSWNEVRTSILSGKRK